MHQGGAIQPWLVCSSENSVPKTWRKVRTLGDLSIASKPDAYLLVLFKVVVYILVVLSKVMNIFNKYKGLISALIGALLLSCVHVPFVVASGFKDVSGTTKYADAINFVHERHIVDGMPDGTYHPNQPINRAELVKVVMLATNAPGLDSAVFSSSCANDLALDSWATKYICYAKVANLIDGYPDNTFKPWQPVTYAEALKVVMNSFGLAPEPTDAAWYDNYQASALVNGIAVPEANLFLPLDRAEMAELMKRVVLHNQSGDLVADLGIGMSKNLLPSVSLPIQGPLPVSPQYYVVEEAALPQLYSSPTAIRSSSTPIVQPHAYPSVISAPNGYYKNVDGVSVPRPYESSTIPANATAICNDGTYSLSLHHQGSCRGHDGVSEWLN